MSPFEHELREWWNAVLFAIPGRCGVRLRRLLFLGPRQGRNVTFLRGSIFYAPHFLSIGDESGIASGCHMNAEGGIEIGRNVLIGPGTCIWSQNHRFEDTGIPISEQGYDRKQVKIEDDVWIGARCVILPGVCVARGTIVAAGAVVTSDTRPYSIVAGVPARLIKRRIVDRDSADVKPLAQDENPDLLDSAQFAELATRNQEQAD